jgi:hypothetical protein
MILYRIDAIGRNPSVHNTVTVYRCLSQPPLGDCGKVVGLATEPN